MVTASVTIADAVVSCSTAAIFKALMASGSMYTTNGWRPSRVARRLRGAVSSSEEDGTTAARRDVLC
jgi:hypothetical protein